MNIEVYADIWCPFAHVGLRLVDDQRRRHRPDLGLIVRAWPLELVNGEAADAAATVRHADELREQVDPTLFAGLDIDHFPKSTLEGLALVARAYRRGTETGTKASFAVREALFEHGQDISDPAVLAGLAGLLDIDLPDDTDRQAVLDDWHGGQQRGVLGSPHFFAGDANVFCPSLAINRDADGTLSIATDRGRLDKFLRDCFEQSPAN
ncbi:MAG: DsbA family protein [Ilumatobacteraceae bacterium]